jgi:hypothetical protein
VSNPTHTETWRPVVGYEGLYEVSDHGRVRSVDRTFVNKMGVTHHRKGKVLKLNTHRQGYRKAVLHRDNVPAHVLAHIIVAAAFLGPRPEGYCVCHNDGDPSNNHVGNLRYDTREGNMADKVKHGTHQRGERGGLAKLTWPIVREIRARYAAGGVTQRQLAAEYGICKASVSHIVTFRTWTHDPQETP